MPSPDLYKTVSQLVEGNPEIVQILHKWNVDPHFAANLTLTEVCAMHGLNLQDFINQIETLDRDKKFLEDGILKDYSVPELVGYILYTHHAYMDRELPRLENLMAAALREDGARHPGLAPLLLSFKDFKGSVEWHMREEENHLFPFFLSLASSQGVPAHGFTTVENFIQIFQSEEDNIQGSLENLRQMTHGFYVPPSAGQAFHDLFYSLSRMEFEFHRHMHDENFVLLPKVLELEHRILGPPKETPSLTP